MHTPNSPINFPECNFFFWFYCTFDLLALWKFSHFLDANPGGFKDGRDTNTPRTIWILPELWDFEIGSNPPEKWSERGSAEHESAVRVLWSCVWVRSRFQEFSGSNGWNWHCGGSWCVPRIRKFSKIRFWDAWHNLRARELPVEGSNPVNNYLDLIDIFGWGISSIGRARALQARGTGIETRILQIKWISDKLHFNQI